MANDTRDKAAAYSFPVNPEMESPVLFANVGDGLGVEENKKAKS